MVSRGKKTIISVRDAKKIFFTEYSWYQIFKNSAEVRIYCIPANTILGVYMESL